MGHTRIIVSLLREIAEELGVEMRSFSHDWILRFQKGASVGWVFGYDFDLNSACAMRLAGDKAATTFALADAGIPHIPHQLFLSPTLLDLAPAEGIWQSIADAARAHHFQVVCKPNDGTGGAGVFRITTLAELERAVFRLLGEAREFAMCPYIESAEEYRVIVLQGRVCVRYRKVRLTLTGDGIASRMELLSDTFAKNVTLPRTRILRDLGEQKADLSVIPAPGETWLVSWKHNLASGGGAQVLESLDPSVPGEPDENAELLNALDTLAIQAAEALTLQFCSVDIMIDHAAKTPRVLEINSGIMMESLAAHHPEGRAIARRIYREALLAMMAKQ